LLPNAISIFLSRNSDGVEVFRQAVITLMYISFGESVCHSVIIMLFIPSVWTWSVPMAKVFFIHSDFFRLVV
jgi:hypothetical protein